MTQYVAMKYEVPKNLVGKFRLRILPLLKSGKLHLIENSDVTEDGQVFLLGAKESVPNVLSYLNGYLDGLRENYTIGDEAYINN